MKSWRVHGHIAISAETAVFDLRYNLFIILTLQSVILHTNQLAIQSHTITTHPPTHLRTKYSAYAQIIYS